MIRHAIAFVLAATVAASVAHSARAAEITVVNSHAGDVVTLAPEDAGEHTRWLGLSGPSILLRKGRSAGPRLRLKPKVAGTYLVARLPEEDESIRKAGLFQLRVSAREDAAERPTARILGDVIVGADEEVTLRASLVSATEARAVRWRQLSGPRLDVERALLARSTLRLMPTEAGRYRFAARLWCGSGRTPWATFTFEVPRRPDGTPEHRPVARVAGVAAVTVGTEVTLDGSRSSDPDGDELTYVWEKLPGLAGGPFGEVGSTTLPPPRGEGARVRFTPTSPGNYSFALTVVDPSGFRSRPEPIAFEVTRPPGPPAPDPDAADPLDRPLSVLLEDAPLTSLFSHLSEIGVTVRTAPDLGDPVELARKRIDLWVVDLPARRVLDWLGRMLRAPYVIEGPGDVWFTRRAKWLEREELTAETYRIDALHSKDDASGLVAMLRESVRAVLWAGAGAGIGEPDIERGTLSAVLPRSAQRRVSELTRELRRRSPSGPPAPEEGRGFARLLAREVEGDYEDWTLRDVAWDIARQARVNIAFDSTDGRGARKVTLRIGRVTLAKALEALAGEAGLSGYVMEPPGAVWLTEGTAPARTSHCLWQSAEVRGYDVSLLDARHGFSGPMLVHMTKKRVLPERWKNHFVMVGYSSARKRLVVIHHEEVQRAVAAFLDRLAREGRDALEE